jgi:carbonic anhydrase/acetyltransferase-like protein (isoleucine patch superfamily)
LPIYEFEGNRPVIDPSSYIHPQSIIIGKVEIGKRCYIGAGAVIRGDLGKIVIGDGSAIEENCVIHSGPDSIAIIEEDVIVGHAAVIHGPCLIKSQVTIGMGAIVSSQCEMESTTFLGAGSVLPPGRSVPRGKLAVGNPARVVKDLDEKLIAYNRKATKTYQDLVSRYINSLVQIGPP